MSVAKAFEKCKSFQAQFNVWWKVIAFTGLTRWKDGNKLCQTGLHGWKALILTLRVSHPLYLFWFFGVCVTSCRDVSAFVHKSPNVRSQAVVYINFNLLLKQKLPNFQTYRCSATSLLLLNSSAQCLLLCSKTCKCSDRSKLCFDFSASWLAFQFHTMLIGAWMYFISRQ